MNNLKKKLVFSALSFTAVIGLNAANFTGPDGGNWGDSANWDTGSVPAASEEARLALAEDRTINIDGDYSVALVQDGFGAGALTLGGPGKLTIDTNTAGIAVGLDNATGDAGGILQVDGTVVINNSAGNNFRTTMRNGNGASNILRFNPGSNLVLTSGAQTTGTVGTIEFNGNISGESPLFIGSTNASFNEGHDSTELGSVVFFLNSKLTVNGGTVLAPGAKFQVNGVNAVLELNAANTVNEANISIGGSNSLFIDVNANQETMGFIVLPASGQLTVDVDDAVTNLSFNNSYLQSWGTATVTINGFKEGTIRFGTDSLGLTRDQLDAINGGIYSLTADGYLTEESIRYWAGFEIDEAGYVLLAPWIELYAYVDAAPYIWLVGGGWVYMEEAVGLSGSGWSYSYDLAALQIYRTDESGFGYSFAINRWVYSQDEVAGQPVGWFYVL